MSQKGVQFLKQVSEYMAKTKGFDKVTNKIKIIGGGDGKCSAQFTVSEEHLNRGGGLHGGFTATLIDNITTYALMTAESHPGVSVDLYVSYLKAAKEGDEVIVEAKTIKKGKSLAFLECELRHKKDGSIIAKGGQTKYVNFS
ncbi:acyl-coenzyme A thioesterase 13-like [Condylostylus longicornis]|uniref:acyl-coenzyme A thioesterase 13-like n=1 Tax=Condylostylus longicornis TaxID=2530218 RepID=UPI00244E54DA|nr:acyl-coenzyme A thioesterase 13-like [Condylostylus longicornis]XP_055385639.1 acyl-coenzyme A thioesterase 13-like [Condylostylus longicornis]